MKKLYFIALFLTAIAGVFGQAVHRPVTDPDARKLDPQLRDMVHWINHWEIRSSLPSNSDGAPGRKFLYVKGSTIRAYFYASNEWRYIDFSSSGISPYLLAADFADSLQNYDGVTTVIGSAIEVDTTFIATVNALSDSLSKFGLAFELMGGPSWTIGVDSVYVVGDVTTDITITAPAAGEGDAVLNVKVDTTKIATLKALSDSIAIIPRHVWFASTILGAPDWEAADSAYFETNIYGTFSKTAGGAGEGDIVYNFWPDTTGVSGLATIPYVEDAIDNLGVPAGVNGNVQYNNSGTLAGFANWNPTTSTLGQIQRLNLNSIGDIQQNSVNMFSIDANQVYRIGNSGLNQKAITATSFFASGAGRYYGANALGASIDQSIGIGDYALYSAGSSSSGVVSQNVGLGSYALYGVGQVRSTSVSQNFAIGPSALGNMAYNCSGSVSNNTGIGSYALSNAGYSSSQTTGNTGIGNSVGFRIGRYTSGQVRGNTLIGDNCARHFSYNATSGDVRSNTAIGDYSMYEYSTETAASYCLALGASAGRGKSGSYKLWISTVNGKNLITGDFNADSVTVNGALRLRDPLYFNRDTDTYVDANSDTLLSGGLGLTFKPKVGNDWYVNMPGAKGTYYRVGNVAGATGAFYYWGNYNWYGIVMELYSHGHATRSDQLWFSSGYWNSTPAAGAGLYLKWKPGTSAEYEIVKQDSVVSLKKGALSGGTLRFYEDSDAGTNYISFRPPALAANVSYTFPIDDGDANELLSTNGSGVLDWVPAVVDPDTIARRFNWRWIENGATVTTSSVLVDTFVIKTDTTMTFALGISGDRYTTTFKADTSIVATKKTIRDSLKNYTIAENCASNITVNNNDANKFYAIAFDDNGVQLNVTETNDSTFTIKRDGYYMANYSLSLSGDQASTRFTATIYVDDVAIAKSSARLNEATANTTQPMSGTCVLDLDVGDTIKLKTSANKVGVTTILYGNLNLVKIH